MKNEGIKFYYKFAVKTLLWEKYKFPLFASIHFNLPHAGPWFPVELWIGRKYKWVVPCQPSWTCSLVVDWKTQNFNDLSNGQKSCSKTDNGHTSRAPVHHLTRRTFEITPSLCRWATLFHGCLCSEFVSAAISFRSFELLFSIINDDAGQGTTGH